MFVYLEVLADALPLGELEFEVLIVEEEGRLAYLAFELPIEPFYNGLGIVATVSLVIGTTVAILCRSRWSETGLRPYEENL